MHDKLHFFSKIIVSMSINVTVFHKPIIRSYINTATQISSLKGLFWSHDEWNKTFWLNIYLNGEKRNYCIFGFHWNRALNTLTGVKFSPHISKFAIVLASTLLGTKAIRRRTIMVFMTEVGDSVTQMRCHCPWLPGVLSNYLYWARAPLLSSLFPRRKSWKNDLASERKGIYLQFAKEAKRTDLFRGSSSLLFFFFLERKAYYVKHNNQQQAGSSSSSSNNTDNRAYEQRLLGSRCKDMRLLGKVWEVQGVWGVRAARGAAGSGSDVLHIQKEWSSQNTNATVGYERKTIKDWNYELECCINWLLYLL